MKKDPTLKAAGEICKTAWENKSDTAQDRIEDHAGIWRDWFGRRRDRWTNEVLDDVPRPDKRDKEDKTPHDQICGWCGSFKMPGEWCENKRCQSQGIRKKKEKDD